MSCKLMDYRRLETPESFINPSCFLVALGELNPPPDDWQEVIEREANAK